MRAPLLSPWTSEHSPFTLRTSSTVSMHLQSLAWIFFTPSFMTSPSFSSLAILCLSSLLDMKSRLAWFSSDSAFIRRLSLQRLLASLLRSLMR